MASGKMASGKMASGEMASGKSKTIEGIDDLLEMSELIKALGVSCTGLQTLDEMKTQVRTALNLSVEKPSWTAGQVRILRKCN